MDRPAGDGLASCLTRHGLSVHLADLRGHGRSGPTPREGADWGYDDIVFRDLPALVADARDRHPGLPVFLVGHSLAGHCGLAAAGCGAYGDRPPDGHVLFAVNTWIRGMDTSAWRDMLRWRDVQIFRLLTALWGYFPSRTVRMGPAEEAATYVSDLSRSFLSGRWGSADGAHDYYAGLARVRGPVLSLAGAADRLMAHPKFAEQWSAAMTGADLEFRVLGAGDLGLTADPGHMELVTDRGSTGVWDEVGRWIAARC